MAKNWLFSFVDFEKNAKKGDVKVAPESFRGDDKPDDSAEKEYIKEFKQGS